MFWFVILLVVLGAGFYLYSKLKKIEEEILAEQEAAQRARQQERQSPPQPSPEKQSAISKPASKPPAASQSASPEATSLAEQLLRTVREQPGIKQTELYPLFSTTPKRTLQYTLRELTDAGRIRREKQGNSFLLHPDD